MDESARQPEIGDAFGHVLSRCWESGAERGVSFEIIERDDGYLDLGDASRYFDGPDHWNTAEVWGCDQVAGRILDIGCGAGRHSVILAHAGQNVVGLDPSPGAVDVARRRGLHTVRGSLTEIPDELGSFDTFLLLGHNLALLGPGDTAVTSLQALAARAKPGTQLIGDLLDPYRTSDPDHLAYPAPASVTRPHAAAHSGRRGGY